MTEIKVCPHENRPVMYFQNYTEMADFVAAVPAASANISYFEPSIQKWAMIYDPKRSGRPRAR